MPCKQNTAFMKKLFIPTLIAAGLSTLILTLPSCSPDERQGSEEPLLELTSPEEMSIPAEGGNFLIQYRITNPTKDGTVTAWTDEDCEWIEDLNSRSSYGAIAEDPDNARIPVGTYTLDVSPSPSCQAGTFSRANSGFFTTDADGVTTPMNVFDSATLTVSASGDEYMVELICQTSDDNLVRYVYYTGDVLLKNYAY